MNKEAQSETNLKPYPIIYCDENLNVADISPDAKEKFSRLRGASMKRYLSARDTSALLSCLHSDFLQHNNGLFVDFENLRGAKCAHVTITRLFGRVFFEMRVFRSRAAMFKDFDVSRLVLSEIPYIPAYSLERDRINVNNTRDKLERVFSSGYLRNLYYTAVDPFKKSALFPVDEVTRRIFYDLTCVLDLKAQFTLTTEKGEGFSREVIDVSNFVNLVAILMKICSDVSASGKVSATLSMDTDRVSLLFVTAAKESETVFFGGFAFPFLAEMYPKSAPLIWAAKYISELFGLRCYAELSGKNTLALELLMRPCPPDMEIGVMHPETEELEKLVKEAPILIERLEQAKFQSGK